MSYFVQDPEELRDEAQDRVRASEKVLKRAEKNYRRDSSRVNLIALKASARRCKETKAMAEEWDA